MGYGPIGTNIFNIADMGILFGFILVIYRSWALSRLERAAERHQVSEEAGPAEL